MKLLWLTTSLVVFMASAYGIDCQVEKGSGSGWAWRMVDGKRCWYKGEPLMDKKKLRWVKERPRLLESYWPPLQEKR